MSVALLSLLQGRLPPCARKISMSAYMPTKERLIRPFKINCLDSGNMEFSGRAWGRDFYLTQMLYIYITRNHMLICL